MKRRRGGRAVARSLAPLLPLRWAALVRHAEGRGGTLDLLFMADIGHSRADARDLTSTFPMGASAREGAFSLYEGLRDFVERQGASPEAVLIAGDVSYTGGSAAVLNHTRRAFQSYLLGTVPEDMVFPAIGNHDIHFLGCSAAEFEVPWKPCFYGARESVFRSEPDLSFDEWRSNWLRFFPGLARHAILPPMMEVSQQSPKPAGWSAPARYNLDLDRDSSIYIIFGILSGSKKLARTNDTPREYTDAAAPGGGELECAFLRDSLAHGRALGKTVFVYVTHHFLPACQAWTLIRQIDVWIYGHQHNYWQNMAPGATIIQEERHYPARVLIGNGGFDEGIIDVVSFGHMREEVNGDRVLVRIEIKDTCLSGDTACPSPVHYAPAHCWASCRPAAGGFDGGGGPRAASPSSRGFGFVLDAPRRQRRPPLPAPAAPVDGSWLLEVLTPAEGSSSWLALGPCLAQSLGRSGPPSRRCVALADSRRDAVALTFYDGDAVKLSARAAVEDSRRGPLVLSLDDALVLDQGFWDVAPGNVGTGLMRPSDGVLLGFAPGAAAGEWQLLDVAWRHGGGTAALQDAASAPGGSGNPSGVAELVRQLGAKILVRFHLCVAGSVGGAASTARQEQVVI